MDILLRNKYLVTVFFGKQIAYVIVADKKNPNLHVMYAEGGNDRKLAENAHEPTWAPDGSRLLFERDGNIWRADPAGGNQVQLTRNGGAMAVWQRVVRP